jgi:hypothetical protein
MQVNVKQSLRAREVQVMLHGVSSVKYDTRDNTRAMANRFIPPSILWARHAHTKLYHEYISADSAFFHAMEKGSKSAKVKALCQALTAVVVRIETLYAASVAV